MEDACHNLSQTDEDDDDEYDLHIWVARCVDAIDAGYFEGCDEKIEHDARNFHHCCYAVAENTCCCYEKLSC